MTRTPSRAPDLVIGEEDTPYLRRWYVIPRNPIFNIYRHEILRSDDDRALHDHPWWNVSIILDGGYWEETPGRRPDGERSRVWYGRGAIKFRLGKSAHRLVVDPMVPVAHTLFITGPRFRAWGFHCPQGWRHWKVFTDPDHYGKRGVGCGEITR